MILIDRKCLVNHDHRKLCVNPDDLSHETEENGIVSNGCHSCFLANVGTKLIDEWVALDVEEFRTNVLNECNCSTWKA